VTQLGLAAVEEASDSRVADERPALVPSGENPASPRRCCETCGRPYVLTPLDTPASHKARTRDPASAKAAAARSFPRQASQRHRLLCAVAASPSGLTSEEAGAAAHIPYVSASTRMTELERGGWLCWSGRTRPTSSGGNASVMELTWAARMKLAESEAAA
jgi:hypothetical protein